jgi:hypothetical protein
MRVGQAFWLDWGEGAGDEYAAIPGAGYELLVHDGSWGAIAGQVAAARAEAKRATENAEAPVLLVIDSYSQEWEQLKNYADTRARQSPQARRKLEKNPNAEVSVPLNIWSDVHQKHYRLLRMLLTFPGIVVITARGKETTALDGDGRPIPGERSYKVEGHKNLAYDASAWVRLSREAPPTVIGARSVHAGIRPGVDPAKQVPDLSLDWLVFDLLLSGSLAGRTRDLPTPPHDDTPPAPSNTRDDGGQGPDRQAGTGEDRCDSDRRELAAAGDRAGLRALYLAAKEAAAPTPVLERIIADGKRLATPSGESAEPGQQAEEENQAEDGSGEEQRTGERAEATDTAVRVRTPTPDRLRTALAEVGATVTEVEDGLRVTGARIEQIGEAAAAAGIVLHELSPQAGSLEQAFMQMTGQDVQFRAGAGTEADGRAELNEVLDVGKSGQEETQS